MRALAMLRWAAAGLALFALLAAAPASAFYLPGVAPTDFAKGDELLVKLVNVLMESKGGKKSSSSSSLMYEAPLGYSIEDVRPAGGTNTWDRFEMRVHKRVFDLVNQKVICIIY